MILLVYCSCLMTVSFKRFQAIVDVLNNILEETNLDGWRDLQNVGHHISNLDLTNVALPWQVVIQLENILYLVRQQYSSHQIDL